MSDLPNVPVPDELAAVRAQRAALETREEALKLILLNDPSARTGAEYVAVIKTIVKQTLDQKQLRLAAPDLVAEHTHAVEHKRIDLPRITEDGEIVSARKLRNTEKAT